MKKIFKIYIVSQVLTIFFIIIVFSMFTSVVSSKNNSENTSSSNSEENNVVSSDKLINTKDIVYPLNSYIMTANYGSYSPWGEVTLHYGVDMAAPSGTKVYAIGNGTVYDCGYDPMWFGNYTYILYKFDNTYVSIANFHQSYINVKIGDVVDNNTVLGGVGTTGNSTGNHLHFEVAYIRENEVIGISKNVHNKYRVDPREFICFPQVGGSYSGNRGVIC